MIHRFMSKHKAVRCVGIGALCAALLAANVPVYAVGDGVTPTYDEAYYATTDYYGNLSEGGVVKSYATNGASQLRDYGDYDEVINLTDGTQAQSADGSTVFDFSDGSAPDHFYFEGKTAKPFEALPWTLSVHYTLNGVPTKAEDLAGKTGVVEIVTDAIPNDAASDYAKHNYTLEAMAIFNQDDILSLEAPGAQVQMIGNLRVVLFLGFPGEEGHYTIRVGSNDFSFSGMTFLMVPATLSQLQEISKLGERKDELEENYNKLSDSLDTLLDSLNDMSGSLYATANGLDQLDTARETISSSKSDLYAKGDLVLGDLDVLNQSLSTLPGHLDQASQVIDDTTKALDSLNDSARDVQDELEKLQDEVDDLNKVLKRIAAAGKASADDLEKLGDEADRIRTQLDDLLPTLAELKLGVGAEEVTIQGKTLSELNAALEQAQALNRVYQSVGQGSSLSFDQFSVAALMVQASQNGQSLSADQALAQVAQMKELVAGVDEKVAAMEQAGASEEQALAVILPALEAQQPGAAASYYKAKQLQCAYAAVTGGAGSMDSDAFLVAMLYMNKVTGASTTLDTAAMADAKQDASSLAKLRTSMQGMTASAQELCRLLGTQDGLSGDLSSLLRLTAGTLEKTDDLADRSKALLDSLDDALDALDSLHSVMKNNSDELKQTLSDSKSTVEGLSTLLTDTHQFLGTFEDVLKTAGSQADAGTKQTLEGLSATLRAAANSLSKTNNVKSAKDGISSIIEDTWNEYTGDVNNLLLMDANADAESLTDTRNPAPQSIQVLIRTQEIETSAGTSSAEETEQTVSTTFGQRVVNLFKSIGAALFGIFRH